MKGYSYHYQKNREAWTEKFFNEHHPKHEEWTQLKSMFMEDELADHDEEYKWSLESLEECEQVRIIWDSKHGHCLKIKWEHAAWWTGDVMHHYYCVMLPIDDVELLEPYDLAMKSKHTMDIESE